MVNAAHAHGTYSSNVRSCPVVKKVHNNVKAPDRPPVRRRGPSVIRAGLDVKESPTKSAPPPVPPTGSPSPPEVKLRLLPDGRPLLTELDVQALTQGVDPKAVVTKKKKLTVSPDTTRNESRTNGTGHEVSVAAPEETHQGPPVLRLDIPEDRYGRPLLTETDVMKVTRGYSQYGPWPAVKWPENRSFLETVSSKALDTLDDILLIARRTLAPLPTDHAVNRIFVKKGDQGADKDTLKLETKKPVVLVLGTGWGGHALSKVIDTDQFEVVVVSPRNHFLFTPMLPSTAVGTVEFRSLLEPIRVANPFIDYCEAMCDGLDVEKKVAYCTSAIAYESGRRPQFEIPYDVCVVAVGEKPATYDTPGVKEHCYFMKEISDCVGLRTRIGECFELAALPGTTEEEKKKALHFVVVGGGPTGVEFAGTLSDFVRVDLKKKYPELMRYVRVSLLQSANSILTQFSANLAQQAMSNFESAGVEVRTGVRVVEVTHDQIVLKSGDKLDYGVCVWSTGNASRKLIHQIMDQIPEQVEFNSNKLSKKLLVDPFLRVVGAKDILALGDCSSVIMDALPATAQVAAQQGAYVARLVNRGYNVGKGGIDCPPPMKELAPEPSLLQSVGLPDLLSSHSVPTTKVLPTTRIDYYLKPFHFLSLGIMAYVGNDKALTQVEAFDTSVGLYGAFAFLLWRSVYITKQVSFRNRVLILFDWLKARVFGRDLSQF